MEPVRTVKFMIQNVLSSFRSHFMELGAHFWELRICKETNGLEISVPKVPKVPGFGARNTFF
jgi:hypothetical protein